MTRSLKEYFIIIMMMWLMMIMMCSVSSIDSIYTSQCWLYWCNHTTKNNLTKYVKLLFCLSYKLPWSFSTKEYNVIYIFNCLKNICFCVYFSKYSLLSGMYFCGTNDNEKKSVYDTLLRVSLLGFLTTMWKKALVRYFCCYFPCLIISEMDA